MSWPFLTFVRENSAFLIAGVLLTFTSSFGQTFFISIFAADIMDYYNLTDGQWGLIYSLGTAVSAVIMLWAGALTDRIRVRQLGIYSLVGLAVACIFMAVNPWLGMLPVLIFALRLCGQGMLSHIAKVAMARWFVAMRGRALAVATLGFSAGEAILPILFVFMNTLIDWRLLWVVSGIFVIAMLPIMVRLLRKERTPRSHRTEDEAYGMSGRHWTRTDMLKDKLFWLVLPAVLGPSAFVTALFFQQVHLAEVKGWSHVGFVALFPLYTGVAVVSLALTGWLIDRVGARRLISFSLLPLVIGFLLMGFANSIADAAVSMVLIGVSVGAVSTLPSAFWAEMYGTGHLGGIKAVATSTLVLGSAIGPALTGVLIDYGVDFSTQLLWIAGYLVIAAAMTGIGVYSVRSR
jgi:MFS family permease